MTDLEHAFYDLIDTNKLFSEKDRAVGVLYAHTPSKNDPEKRWHELAEHARCVAKLAAEHAAAFGSERAGWWAGILHDSGKASDDFQRYLRLCYEQPDRKHDTVDHKGAGFLRALQTCAPLALLVQSHHGGLIDHQEYTEKYQFHRSRASQLATQLAKYDALDLIPVDKGPPPLTDFETRSATSAELLLRMLFSALVDADAIDTERHRDPERAALRGSTVSASELWERFEKQQNTFISGLDPATIDSDVNRVRADVYDCCLAAAELPSGFFRLTVPTGGGKTRSGLAFALRHAAIHDLRRVILTVPYLTITDQTARIVHSIFPDDRIVLEHHSAAGQRDGEDEPGSQDEREAWRRLTAENWDAPIVITTMVQFFESLFGRRTGECRKLHRIAQSVIVLDEAQTLPLYLRDPIYDVLQELVTHYGATVVLCTATQPALDELAARIRPVEIVPNPARHFRTLSRVDYEWPSAGAPRWTWDRVADEMRTAPQALAIVNIIANAQALSEALGDEDGHLHLSSRMCGAHRRDMIDQVRVRLDAKNVCRLVSTQVVEAGVDLDFPLLLRALGPLDRIVQAAGRCNREGTLPGKGRVVVFDPEDGGMPPGPYRIGEQTTNWLRDLLQADPDLDDPATFDQYFVAVNQMVGGDVRGIQRLREGLNYRTVAREFRLIDDDQTALLVRYRGLDWDSSSGQTHPVDQLIRQIQQVIDAGNGGWLRKLLRQAQPYIVNIRRNEFRKLAEKPRVLELMEDLWLWDDEYHPKLGVVDTHSDSSQWII